MVKFTDFFEEDAYINVSIYNHKCDVDVENNKSYIDLMGFSVFYNSHFRLCLNVDDAKIFIEKLKLEISKIDENGNK
jgi:hypothetical protein